LDAFDEAERSVLTALFINWHQPGQHLLDNDLLEARYGVQITDKWFRSIVMALNERGLVDVHEDKGTLDATLRDSAFKAARAQLLTLLGGNRFDVDWEKREIHCDVPHKKPLPLPVNWRWYNYGPPRPQDADTTVVSVELNWQAWGTIFGGLALLVALVALLLGR